MTVNKFNLPDVGEGLTEAEIVSWNVKPGDTVAINDILCEIETAKSLVELPSPFAGTVTELLVPVGVTVDVGTPIISVSDAVSGDPTPADVPAPAVPAAPVATPPLTHQCTETFQRTTSRRRSSRRQLPPARWWAPVPRPTPSSAARARRSPAAVVTPVPAAAPSPVAAPVPVAEPVEAQGIWINAGAPSAPMLRQPPTKAQRARPSAAPSAAS